MENFINNIMSWIQLKIFGDLELDQPKNPPQTDPGYMRKDEFVASMHKETTKFVSSRFSRGSVHLQNGNFIVRREELL